MARIEGDNFDNTLTGTGDSDTLVGLAGNDTLIGNGGADTYVGGAGNDIFQSDGGGNDTVDYSQEDGLNGVVVNLHALQGYGSLGPDSAKDTFNDIDSIAFIRHVIGTNFADDVHGGGHANRFFGGGGNDTFNGRGGQDTAIFSGVASNYQISFNPDGTIIVTDMVGGEGQDSLVNVEHLEFSDTSIAIPAIISVSIPNQAMKLNSTVSVDIETTPYAGILSLAPGSSIAGYALTSLIKIADDHYTAQFVVQGAADVPAGSDLVVDLELIDLTTNVPTFYSAPIVQDLDEIDSTLPTVSGIVANQNVITLTFSEKLGLGNPGPSGFSVIKNGVAYDIIGLELGPDDQTVFLNMQHAALPDDTITVAYLGPSTPAPHSNFVDLAGNEVQTFGPRAATNDTGPAFYVVADTQQANEGDTGSTTYSFTIYRTGDAAGPASVNFTIAGASLDAILQSPVNPANAQDFGGIYPSGTVNFAIGEHSRTVTVDVSGDIDVELTEYFTLTLSNPVGATLQPPRGHITGAYIENDDVSNPGGGIPTTEPPTSPPFVPPIVVDPSPGDSFNEAQAGASVAGFFTGEAPTPEKQAEFNAFATRQYEAYAAAGVADPALGAYEALGRGFAETLEFAAKYGLQAEANFIASSYAEVFGRAPTPAQQAHFQAQIDYFELIYENAGIASVQADLFAKGAALGQMLGYASLARISDSASDRVAQSDINWADA